MRFFLGYRCSGCGREIPAGSIANECPECARPLLSVYDIDALKKRMTREEFFNYRPGGVWRFSPLLPDFGARVSLGEGNTPLIRARRLGGRLGFDNLYIKDESRNPAGSFKARGMAVAVSRLVGLNIKEAWLPSAGNAALALSAYCAQAGIDCNVYLPSSASDRIVEECRLYGAKVKVVRQRGKNGPQYLMTNCLTASNSKVRKRAKLRWEVEVFFRRIKHHLGFGKYRVRRWQAIEKVILTVWIAYRIALSESPASLEGVLVTLEEHQQILAWEMLQSRMKDYLLTKLILLKIVLDQLLIPLLL